MPMKNLLTKAGLSLLVTGIVSVGISSVSHAQDASEASEVSQDAPEVSIEPESLPGNYGLVRSYNGQNLDVRLLDGTEKSYTVPEGSSAELKQGDLVGFDVDEEGVVSRVQPPAVDEVIRGTVTDIDPESQTVTLMPEGADEAVDTQISQATISKLGLEPGKEVMVTRFQGTWASKVCLPRAAAPVAAPPVEEPIAPTGGIEEPIPVEEPLPAEEPIPALW